MFSSFVDVLCATQWLYPVKCNLFYSLSIIKGAILSCTRLQRAHMEGASLRGCNFEDPAGTRANLEGMKIAGA